MQAAPGLSCWGLVWHSIDGPSFEFAAHDFFDTSALPLSSAVRGTVGKTQVQEAVKVSREARALLNASFESSEYQFVTVRVLYLTYGSSNCKSRREHAVLG
jgi:hypothetical protein